MDFYPIAIEKLIEEFAKLPSIGQKTAQRLALHVLNLPEDQRDKILQNQGIPCDSTDNQFKSWVRNARAANRDLRIAIKADASTPYSVIKNVMNSLQDLKENRYNLITSLKKVED